MDIDIDKVRDLAREMGKQKMKPLKTPYGEGYVVGFPKEKVEHQVIETEDSIIIRRVVR